MGKDISTPAQEPVEVVATTFCPLTQRREEKHTSLCESLVYHSFSGTLIVYAIELSRPSQKPGIGSQIDHKRVIYIETKEQCWPDCQIT